VNWVKNFINPFQKFHLFRIKNRIVIHSQLNSLCLRFQEAIPRNPLYQDQEQNHLFYETYTFLDNNFGKKILELFLKQTPFQKSIKKDVNFNDNFFMALVQGLSTGFENIEEQAKLNLLYKTNFLVFLRDC